MSEKVRIEEIGPECFSWEKYESNYGGRLGLDFRSTVDANAMEREIRSRCVGWCDGSKLRIRPKSDMVAVMLEDDDFEKFWFHYPKTCFEEIIKED